ncbi:MAG: 30S ribosomal protein S6 [Deltaproteobacteria bacterium]|nr:30S ribosomal protein S6 [Deltaproteobacteria bacterium]
MAEKWRKYETLMIFDAELGTEGTEGLIQRARDFIGQENGRILKTERWGLRDLAFELKGHRRGYYLLLEYAGVPRVATELDRKLNLIDSVVKFQSVKLDEGIDPATLPEAEEVVSAPTQQAAVLPPMEEKEGGAEEAEEGGASEEE